MADRTKFLPWLLVLSSSSLCLGSDTDIQCLKTVQHSIIYPSGILKSSWNFDNSTNDCYCGFTGVECGNNGGGNWVFSLSLGNLGLQGPFPEGLQNCTSMMHLDLSNNNFSGPIPSYIAQQMPYLIYLNLSYNSFSGEIPKRESIADMEFMNKFDLQHNQLSGQIPFQFSGLSQFTLFNVADNLLSGPIPYLPHNFLASNFSGNQDLCGTPLDYCPRRLHGINAESIIGAAVGFISGFVVVFYFPLPHCFIFSERLRPYVVRIC